MGGGEGFLSGASNGVQGENGSHGFFGEEGGINARFAKNSSGSKISPCSSTGVTPSSITSYLMIMSIINEKYFMHLMR